MLGVAVVVGLVAPAFIIIVDRPVRHLTVSLPVHLIPSRLVSKWACPVGSRLHVDKQSIFTPSVLLYLASWVSD